MRSASFFDRKLVKDASPYETRSVMTVAIIGETYFKVMLDKQRLNRFSPVDALYLYHDGQVHSATAHEVVYQAGMKSNLR
jgi:hypothetical protein